MQRSVLAEQITLTDGTVIEAEQIWQHDDAVWFRQGGMIRRLHKSSVLKIGETLLHPIQTSKNVRRTHTEKPKPPKQIINSAEASLQASPTTKQAAQSSSTRIILQDKTFFDVDSTWNAEGKIGYRLGNMYAFLERGMVAQIIPNYVPPTAPPPSAQPSQSLPYTTGHSGLDTLIETNARRHQIDPLLIYLVMKHESSFNHRAVSRAGARGLMQLMPATARQLGVRNIDNPVENVEAGTRYLSSLLQRYAGDITLALAAYNAGENAVARYGNRVPPYRETMHYVQRISGAYSRARY